jgi:hypothetical protein
MIDWIKRHLGPRWALYFVKDEKTLVYALFENSVYRLLSCVSGFYAEGEQPSLGWSLVLNFNRTHQTIPIEADHFKSDGPGISDNLRQRIAEIDPNYRVRDGRPIFIEIATNRRILVPTIDEQLQKFENLFEGNIPLNNDDYFTFIREQNIFKKSDKSHF